MNGPKYNKSSRILFSLLSHGLILNAHPFLSLAKKKKKDLLQQSHEYSNIALLSAFMVC